MARPSLKTLTWQHRYAAIFKCFAPSEDETKKIYQELTVVGRDEIRKDADLTRVLGQLQRDLVTKRLYSYAENPTSRLLEFRSDAGADGSQTRLDGLRSARDKALVRRRARELAEHYVSVPGIREGVLIFLVSTGIADDLTDDCLFVFKCDFEQISRITERSLFEQVEDAIVEKTKKAALYPYFDDGRFDQETVRVFDELGQTQYWLDFLELGERKAEYLSTQQATDEVLGAEYPELAAEYADAVALGLPSVRSLEADEALVQRRRLDTTDGMKVSRQVAEKAGDPKVTLRLGEVTVKAPLSQYGVSWLIAAEGDRRYVLVRGDKLESRTKMLTPLDAIEPASLEEALRRLAGEFL